MTHSADASAPIRRSDLGVVVVGETPYSEGFGDVGGPRWAYDPGDNNLPRQAQDMQLSAVDKAAVDKVCAAARKCVVVTVSGRPLIVGGSRRSTGSSPRGFRAARGPAWPTPCSASARTPASCR